MSDTTEGFISGGFVFYNNFDSANLAKVIQVDVNAANDNGENENDTKSAKNGHVEENLDYEFNLWTKHDCHGTEYENSNRTWFYFGVKAPKSGALVRLNVINLNKQVKMFSQGMCPVYKVLPGHPQWERIRDKPIYALDEKSNEFTLSFTYRTPDNLKAITYFAFTYPFTYNDLQTQLKKIQSRLARRTINSVDDIYYHRECVIKSLEGRRLELLTISSYQNISMEREDSLMNLFPENNELRPFKFKNKKVIFISARVHPGETPSSFVLNGLLNLLLNREDPIAITLRRLYVFKLIPMLNPDGVAKGHYRMDTKGVNLNRVYLNPSESDHPTIFAARTLIRYYHNFYKLPEETDIKIEKSHVSLEENRDSNLIIPESVTNVVRDTTNHLLEQVTLMSLEEKSKSDLTYDKCHKAKENILRVKSKDVEERRRPETADNKRKLAKQPKETEESGIFLYVDLHGHASKKGIFMYGNYFDDSDESITCLLLPKLMSLNNPNFHFTSCNFAERNMYLIDKRDGMSREGSGRVAVYKLTGLIRSYTLECNYNSGRLINALPPRVRDNMSKIQTPIYVPPKYTPAVYEEVGAALGPSILDLTGSNPNSRLSNSQYHSLRGLKSYLKLTYANNCTAPLHKPLHKENSGSVSSKQENKPEEEIEMTVVVSSTSIENSTKTEINLIKKPCIVRRTTSLYTAIKKIKTNKKPRQIINRKLVKAPNSSNLKSTIQSTSLISKIHNKNQLKKKKFQKTLDYRMETNNCLDDNKCTLMVQAKKRRSVIKNKITTIQKQNANMEITTIVKQGTKRLKVSGPKIIKTRPEIGESASDETFPDQKIIKATSTRSICVNKQKSNATYVKGKKQFLKVEQKSKKSSNKMKMKNRKKTENCESIVNQISSDNTN
ncbi:cytosolic carboxypeptidase-like protein 5 isoform X1 [Leptopilina heterotoma]|uniref:cytosolic carboxypeptidase-like protein 5 isoform X1 n=1 Tax=Leptopilina heterotoma TaxID=63436 RepID=UPI001CA9BC0C|nr:cytosolic carboxypeptidase-like protein 5 isoform X1 [Leptopilina heterotoma]XP_043465437.1 cytosolic carboxypeptidase-like protein 5 isoform X1 [Leptopilina heterotoma]XP_043465438.1 cytosolic carboxypeptidase-like protein 5 isoform X1 [Leptopilina heterotoma]